jgi:phage gpG-like protein
MTSTVTVAGAARLTATMRRAARDLGDLSAAGSRTAFLIASTGRSRAPRRTGRLAGSLVATSTGQTAEVASGRAYAGVVHYGWPARRIAANPFLLDAATATAPAWTPLYAAEVAGAIDRVKGV